jgi:16S rRNA (adenine1518-N6/adenine1519-N6)-dimethyltransferase
VIAAHGLAAKKSLGQHFLLDSNLTRRIARASGPFDGTILEIGPGPGGLTRALLAEGAERIVAIERDARCIPALRELADLFPGRLDVVEGDALLIDEPKLLDSSRAPGPVRIAANLPYNVGTALLVKWLTCETWPPFWSSLTLMFQREVAERIVSPKGSKAYGRLSVLAQWRATAKILFDVSNAAFVPPPKVTSSVVRLEPRPAPEPAVNVGDLEAVTAAAFGQRRKMLRQSLRALVPEAEPFIRTAGLDPTARAEELSPQDFVRLALLFSKERDRRKG